MTDNENPERTAAVCRECEEAYAVWAWPDGQVQVIGQHECGCGANDLTPVDPSL